MAYAPNTGMKNMPSIVTRSAGKSRVTVPASLQSSPVWHEWTMKANHAKSYYAEAWPKFNLRDENYEDQLMLRHGLISPNIPPSHRDIVRNIGTKKAGEILARLVAIMTAAYPEWTFQADGLSHTAGLRASTLSAFWRSFWLGLEDKALVPVVRIATDQQLAYGGALLKVIDRTDRWAYLPEKNPEESDRDYAFRLKSWKARNLPFDIIVPEYNTVYYERTTDGLVRVLEKKTASCYDLASEFGGSYDADKKELVIPVEYEMDCEYGECEFYDTDMPHGPHIMVDYLKFQTAATAEYQEYWNLTDPLSNSGYCVYTINDIPVRVDYFTGGIPYFLALGEVTSSPDPGRLGLPILYNAIDDFLRLNDLRAMEDSFLWKHGYARLKHKLPADTPGTVEPDLADQEDEEEVIGEVLETKGDEDWAYLVPANVSVLFADAKNDAKEGINDAALADVMTGKMPPSGTTGFLMSQLLSAAVSKYVPLLHQLARALRGATLYMQDKIDSEFQSSVIVYAQGTDAESTFIEYKPGFSRGNHNLDIEINAPLPSDKIARAQFLIAGHDGGFIARERVQREGFDVRQPALEDEKIGMDDFRKFYRPIAMLRSMQRAGQMDQVLEAARMGLLPGALQDLALMFAAGPDGLAPMGNPNGVIQAAPGLGEPGVPTVGATANNRASVVKGGGRAAGAERRPGGPRNIQEPVVPTGGTS